MWFDKNLNLAPHLCAAWETNADASEWTFHLRQGARWSDGVEFTSDDIMWWYQHEITDSRIFSSVPSQWTTGGAAMTVEAPDKYTVKMRFSQPNVLFVYQLARRAGGDGCPCPSHYMKRYHIDFTSDPAALRAEATAAGYGSWGDYYRYNRSQWHLNPLRPDLGPWLAKHKLDANPFVMERNPYYYCVDADRNQLPYIDMVTHRLFSADSEFTAWIRSGLIDFQGRHTNLAYYDDYKAGEGAGGYRVLLGIWGNHVAIALNLTTTSSARLREFFRDTQVRKALSLAVDRAYLNTQYYYGLATPRQYSPLSVSPQYYPTLSNAYIAYDVAQANALLDAAGYAARDAQGFRLWRDGSGTRLSFTIEGPAPSGSAEEQAVQRVIQYYAAVGVKAAFQYVDRDTYMNHCGSNQIEAGWWGADRAVLPIVAPSIFLGTQIDRPWACAWGLWRNNPNDANGAPPPADHWIRDIWSKWDQIAVQRDADQRNVLFREILDIWARELPLIGYLGEIPLPVIMKDSLHNFASGYPLDDTTADEQLLSPETLYWDCLLLATLSINYTRGRPGSYFTLKGTNYPPNSTAVVACNGQVLQTLATDGLGEIEFVLNTGQADPGRYDITVSVNPSATISLELGPLEPQRPKESSAPEVSMPKGIAIINKVHLPLVQR